MIHARLPKGAHPPPSHSGHVMTDQPPKPAAAGPDYSSTLFLPQTDFPMRAGLPQREPELLARWEKINLYKKLREAAKGRDRFILHDGPPYANGNIHIGHALNKILKDIVTRSQQMLGKDSNYVPGWDCHGLPIEWKIEEEYRAKGKGKPNLSDPAAMNVFRKECRDFAANWINIQREEFKRLGVTGDWDNPYSTMAFAAEAQIARELMKFATTGQLYRGSKPVMWSVVEQTALAEAEVDYHAYQSDQVWVAFPCSFVVHNTMESNPDAAAWNNFAKLNNTENGNQPASVVIWTTTPWTIPGNRAISFSSKVSYGLYEIVSLLEGSFATVGRRYIVADKLSDEMFGKAKAVAERLQDVAAETLAAGVCYHSLYSSNFGYYGFNVPLLAGDHVTDDAGTGFVHTAPGHGREDFDIWTAAATQQDLRARGIKTEIPYTVDNDGFFTKDAPGFEGRRVITDKGDKGDANEAVIKALIEAGNLVARGRLKHQYPHSWRSRKPVIFRNTPQWFIHMDKPLGDFTLSQRERVDAERRGEWNQPSSSKPLTPPLHGDPLPPGEGSNAPTLRDISLQSIRQTQWVPPSGENRINGMIEAKPDWVVSRQRAWGVPITVFVRKGTNDVLKDADVNAAIAKAFEAEGADAWFADADGTRFLKPFGYSPADYEKINDVLDVWFDSGSTHAFCLENNPEFPSLTGIRRKHDGGRDQVMYLEGSDQHRGWFHSSLIESSGTRGRAPFDIVLTHGFVLDPKGEKMSKSVGNVIAPQDVMRDSGADILRLWVAASDYSDDLRIGKDILKNFVETYRKLRNSLRWMLGTLGHFDGARAESASFLK